MGTGKRIEVHPGTFLVTALMVLTVPFPWILAIIGAATIHELGHLAALRVLSLQVNRIVIGGFGARIETPPLEPAEELICSIAGPVAGLAAILCVRWVPRLAVAALIQSVCNLLPVYPMDGGRVWRAFLALMIGERSADVIGRITDYAVLAVLIPLGLRWYFVSGTGFLVLVIPVIWILRVLLRKIPCKTGGLGLQ